MTKAVQAELATKTYLEDGLLDDLRVDGGHTIGGLAANHSHESHVHQPALNQCISNNCYWSISCHHNVMTAHENIILHDCSRLLRARMSRRLDILQDVQKLLEWVRFAGCLMQMEIQL